MKIEELLEKEVENFGEHFARTLHELWGCKEFVYGLFIHGNDQKEVNRILVGFANAFVLVAHHGAPDLPSAPVEEGPPAPVEEGPLGDFRLEDIIGESTEENSNG